jgi:uncharacterized integral membrane protein
MPPNAESERLSSPEIVAAQLDVELAKAELESNLNDVRDSGKRALVGMAQKARPVLIAAAVVVGAIVLFRLIRRASRTRPAPFAIVRATESTPLVKIALGAAVRGALRVLATRLAEQAAARLVAAAEERELQAQEVDDSASLDALSTAASK